MTLAYFNGLPGNWKITDLMKCVYCQWIGSVFLYVAKMLHNKIWKDVSWLALLEEVLKSLWVETFLRWYRMRSAPLPYIHYVNYILLYSGEFLENKAGFFAFLLFLCFSAGNLDFASWRVREYPVVQGFFSPAPFRSFSRNTTKNWQRINLIQTVGDYLKKVTPVPHSKQIDCLSQWNVTMDIYVQIHDIRYKPVSSSSAGDAVTFLL